MDAQVFYEPTDRGFEARVRERLEFWEKRRRELQQSDETAG
jgi:putative ATPase